MHYIEAVLKLISVLRVNEGLMKTIPTADSPAGEETLMSEKTHSGLADFEAVTTGSVVSHLLEKCFGLSHSIFVMILNIWIMSPLYRR